MMNKLTTLALMGLAALPTNAFFLMPCWPVSTQRIDPIVQPGELSTHVHQIAGGSAFAPAMNYSSTQAASCTTCFVKGDKSNYWVPALYLKHSDGTFERVPQVGSASMYYFNEKSRLGAGETMETFPKGLRMFAGVPTKRSQGTDAESQAVNYKCLDYSGTPTDSKGFPTKNCPNGIRAEVTFPSCWDGKNLDSADHKAHMAYPTGNFENGACPSTHPHHLVTLKVEFIFDTNKFKDQWIGGQQPFVWSNGDPTGFGLHADYFMGWDYNLLESAVNQCFDQFGVLENCKPFAGQIQSAYVNPGTCQVDSFVDEDVGGKVETMPGCNALQNGPSNAVKAACNDGIKLLGKWADAKTNGLLSWLDLGNALDQDEDTPSSADTLPSIDSTKASATIVQSAPSTTAQPTGSNGYAPVVIPGSSLVIAAPSSPAVTTGKPKVGGGNIVTVTINDIVTVTTYTTADSAPAASPAPQQQQHDGSRHHYQQGTHSWGGWRREIGDNIHKHQLRHIRYRRGAQNRQ